MQSNNYQNQMGSFLTRSETQNAYAIVGGCCLGLLLFYLGINAPSMFSIDINFNYGETIAVMIILGITFGYYLGRSLIAEGSGLSIFTASFLATVILIPSLMFIARLEFYADSQFPDWNSMLAMLLPFLEIE